jgi:hypothetical protein
MHACGQATLAIKVDRSASRFDTHCHSRVSAEECVSFCWDVERASSANRMETLRNAFLSGTPSFPECEQTHKVNVRLAHY